jgi:hypothetical protein
MRTTVTLDPDTASLIERRMAERGVGFKQALNDLIRESAHPGDAGYSTPTFALGTPRTDVTHALQLAAEMEDEHIASKLQRGV